MTRIVTTGSTWIVAALLMAGCGTIADPPVEADAGAAGSNGPGVLLVEPSTIDFGVHLVDEEAASATVRLSNVASSGDVTVTALELTGGGQFTIDAPAQIPTLGPGESVELLVRYAAENHKTADRASLSVVTEPRSADDSTVELSGTACCARRWTASWLLASVPSQDSDELAQAVGANSEYTMVGGGDPAWGRSHHPGSRRRRILCLARRAKLFRRAIRFARSAGTLGSR